MLAKQLTFNVVSVFSPYGHNLRPVAKLEGFLASADWVASMRRSMKPTQFGAAFLAWTRDHLSSYEAA